MVSCMIVCSALLYALLACFAAWLILIPGGRNTLRHTMSNLGWRLDRKAARFFRNGAYCTVSFGADLRAFASHGGHLMRCHWQRSTLMLLLGVMLALGAWRFSEHFLVESGGYSDRPGTQWDEKIDAQMSNRLAAQLSDLLEGVPLISPQPLPPLSFSAPPVRQILPLLSGANRNWHLLQHEYEQRLLLVFKIMKEKYGYDMALLEGYRSPERQDMLALAGSNVTNAKAFQSYHQFGLAADCAFFRDGHLLISEKDPWAMRGYRLYGAIAESLGLRWGGRWAMMDLGHTELRLPGMIKNQHEKQ